jgi:hypothetical protein
MNSHETRISVPASTDEYSFRIIFIVLLLAFTPSAGTGVLSAENELREVGRVDRRWRLTKGWVEKYATLESR